MNKKLNEALKLIIEECENRIYSKTCRSCPLCTPLGCQPNARHPFVDLPYMWEIEYSS